MSASPLFDAAGLFDAVGQLDATGQPGVDLGLRLADDLEPALAGLAEACDGCRRRCCAAGWNIKEEGAATASMETWRTDGVTIKSMSVRSGNQ